MPAERPGGPRIVIGRGSRHCEQLLFVELDRLRDLLGRSLMAHPVTLVVPSQSLRLHLLQAMAARSPAWAGIWCRTHYGLAAELVLRRGGELPGDFDVLNLLARRMARSEPALRRVFDHLVDGYRPAAVTVRDLLDAGFAPGHLEALDEVLAQEGPAVAGQEQVERARAVLRVAAGVAAELDDRDLNRRSAVLQRAAEILRAGEAGWYRPGAVLIYGFADATGVATDLLEALLDRHGAVLLLERPRDPADPAGGPAGALFGRRFRERLATRAEPEAATGAPPLGRIDAFRALGAHAEVRELARRLRALLDGGARAEGVAVVARELGGYLGPLRVQCERYGVPISGLAARGPTTPAGRRVGAALDLLRLGRRTPVERWLDARRRGFGKTRSFDLRLALHSLGAGHLEEVPALPLKEYLVDDSFPLPVRLGFDAFEADPDQTDQGEKPDRRILLRRRRVGGATLRAAAGAAARLCRRLARWPESAPLRRHLDLLRELLADDLGWQADEALALEVDQRLDRGCLHIEDLEMTIEEFLLLVRELLADAGRERLGGEGGGVQVLEVVEARGRTFEHLFLIGLNRDVFPRTVREDPLLADPLRRLLGRQGFGVLPDLALKRDGTEEERFLFAQLLTAAPAVTLSWQQVDDDNAARAVSPLVERLRWSEAVDLEPEPPLTRPAHAPEEPTGRDTVPRPLLENALRVALAGGHKALGTVLPLALGDLPEPRRTAAARQRVVAEMDPPLATPARLGPYLGVVGRPLEEADPRREETLWVTTLEGLCACPWQTLLVKVLRLEPLPDPLETLPAIDPLLIGDVVHRAAESIVARRLGAAGPAPAPPRGRLPLPVSWPDDSDLDRILLGSARGALRDRSIALTGFDRVVALAARPYLDQLRRLDWPDGTRVPVLGGEIEDQLRLETAGGARRRLAFRADRLDRTEDGLLFTDYKTGRRPISDKKLETTRRRHLLSQVRAGTRLQAAAYAVAGAGCGRYLFVHPGLDGPEDSRTAVVAAGDDEILAAFDRAVATALDAWELGAFPPRVVRPDRDKEPVRCRYCAVAEACVRGDSGVRRRLQSWAADADANADEMALAALRIWRLPLAPEEGSG